MIRNVQQPKHAQIQHVENQTLPQWRDSKKYNIQSDKKTVLGKECEVKKLMKFLKEMKIFKVMKRLWIADEILTNDWVNSQITNSVGC